MHRISRQSQPSAFGSFIRSSRRIAGLSLSAASPLVGVARTHLWQLEVGRHANPCVSTLVGLARAYKVPLHQLVTLAAEAYESFVRCPEVGCTIARPHEHKAEGPCGLAGAPR